MTVEILEPCGGSYFTYRKGEIISSSDPAVIERLKDLIRGKHAIEVKSGSSEPSAGNVERKVKRNIETH